MNVNQAARPRWATTIGLLFLATTVAVAQTNYQWTQVRSGSWPIDGIAVAPTTPATVLIADGFNLYRSTNAGASWSTASYPFGSFPGDALAFDPTNVSIAYSARSHGMMKSIDGGTTWFHLPNLNAGPGASAIAFDASNTTVVYAGVSVGWGVYRSTNSGATWSNPLSGRDVRALAINPINSQILFAGTKDYYSQPGGVLRSTNGGQNWSSVWPNGQINALAIDPTNPQVVYAGAEVGGVFKSTDGGSNWALSGTALTNIPVSALIIDPTDPSRVYAATKGNGVYLSSNAGAAWTNINSGLNDLNCISMALHSSTRALFVGTFSGYVYRGEAPILLAEALDTQGLTWTSGGAAAWSGQNGVTHDGVDAAQSGICSHNQESWLQTTVNGPGTLSFWWKVSSELNFDFLQFYVDGILQSGSISGEVAWQHRQFTLTAGSHTLRWRYTKDNIGSVGQDKGWLDEVTLPGVPLSYPGTNDDFVLSTSLGSAPLTTGVGYEVKLAPASSLLAVNIASPGGTLNLTPYLVAVQAFQTSLPPVSLPGVPAYFNLNQPIVFVIGGVSSPAGPPIVAPGSGSTSYFQTPTGMLGTSIMIQGIAFSPVAINGIYAITGGHEIRFQ